MTPATVYSALDDWAGNGRQSVWYSCKNYRMNVYCDGENVWIRDVHKFNETIRDFYLDEPCKTHSIIYETLPIMDGLNFTDENTVAGIYLGKGKITETKRADQEFVVLIEGDDNRLTMQISEEEIGITGEKDFSRPIITKKECETVMEFKEEEISYLHDEVSYAVNIAEGKFDTVTKRLVSSEQKLCLKIAE